MKRSHSDLAKMRRAGRVVAEMHAFIRAAVRPGVTTGALDVIGREVLERRGARSNFLGYGNPPFRGVICASPNNVIVHGVPGPVVLVEGDIISIDCGAIVDGWHGDAAFTMGVGAIDEASARLIDVTDQSLAAGIAAMQPGGRLSDIGAAVQLRAESAGFSVVREYTGHGIGLAMHEPPDVPNWGRPGRGRRLAPGQTYAVEPMVCAGRADTRLLDDAWTVVTADGSRAAHAEHTIAITENGPEILTRA
ncbi:MAG TPA: type I methionyl aminopeptidase [Acidimicrobiales bacterium]|nr:type I methionyl aminopeptidase [Acidimicrobiales bacterium]